MFQISELAPQLNHQKVFFDFDVSLFLNESFIVFKSIYMVVFFSLKLFGIFFVNFIFFVFPIKMFKIISFTFWEDQSYEVTHTHRGKTSLRFRNDEALVSHIHVLFIKIKSLRFTSPVSYVSLKWICSLFLNGPFSNELFVFYL